jgi:Paf1 complex subunit CDC73 N-terminal
MPATEALKKLKEALVGGKNVVFDGSDVVWDDVRLPRSADTGYLSKKGKGDAYPLAALLFCHQNESKRYADYVTLCQKENVKWVSIVDQKTIARYLRGEIGDDIPALQVRRQQPISQLAQASAAAVQQSSSSSSRSSSSSSSFSSFHVLFKKEDQFVENVRSW